MTSDPERESLVCNRLRARPDNVVIAAKAHRSHYGFIYRFTQYMRDALPTASRSSQRGAPSLTWPI